MTEAIYKVPIHVGEEAIDVLNHVNNKEYLRWMEEAATKHAAHCGWDFEALRAVNRTWVARQHWIEYLRPAYLKDDLVLCTWVQSAKRVSSLRRYALLRGEELVMVGATEWVLVDFEKRRPALITPEIIDCFIPLAPDAPELKALGINRLVRFAPSPGL